MVRLILAVIVVSLCAFIGGPFFWGFGIFIGCVLALASYKPRWARPESVAEGVRAKLKGVEIVAEKDAHWTLSRGGLTYSLDYEPGGRNALPSLELRRKIHSTGWWYKATRRAGYDRALAKLGLLVEVLTGDPAFDAEFLIRANAPELAARYFAPAERRAAVAALFRAGCASVELEEVRITVAWRPYMPPLSDDDRFLQAAFAPLAALTENVGAVARAAAGPHLTRNPWPVRLLRPVLESPRFLGAVLIALLVWGVADPATRPRVAPYAFVVAGVAALFAAGRFADRRKRRR